jgi:FimV-like protein
MKKIFLSFALISQSLFAITIIGSPNVEINSEGSYLVQIKISSTSNLKEDDISITDFKSDNELSDFNFDYKIFENLQEYKRLTLAIPGDYLEDYISFRLNIGKELKKDIFIFLPQNDVTRKAKSQVSFKLPAKKIYGESQRYDIAKILSEELDYEDSETENSNTFSLIKSNNNDNVRLEEPKVIPSAEVETIWSVSKSVSQNYEASIYQIMWAFYLENPNAFIDENINIVRGDVDLVMPSQDLVESTTSLDAKKSIAFMDDKLVEIQASIEKPVLKLTAPTKSVDSIERINPVEEKPYTDSKLRISNEDKKNLSASEIVSQNTSIINLNSDSDFSQQDNLSNDSQGFDVKDLLWAAFLSLLLGFAIAFMLIRSNKKPVFTKAAVEEDMLDENHTFQTNLSISNDIETQELDLARTYTDMGDIEGAKNILDKLISSSKNDSIVSEARKLLQKNK